MTPKQLAQARLESRARRIRLIRRRIAGGAVTLFAAAWAVIGVQLATGHDPALAQKPTSTGANTSSAAGSTRSASDNTSASSANSGSSPAPTSSASSNTNQPTSSVTTRQS